MAKPVRAGTGRDTGGVTPPGPDRAVDHRPGTQADPAARPDARGRSSAAGAPRRDITADVRCRRNDRGRGIRVQCPRPGRPAGARRPAPCHPRASRAGGEMGLHGHRGRLRTGATRSRRAEAARRRADAGQAGAPGPHRRRADAGQAGAPAPHRRRAEAEICSRAPALTQPPRHRVDGPPVMRLLPFPALPGHGEDGPSTTLCGLADHQHAGLIMKAKPFP